MSSDTTLEPEGSPENVEPGLEETYACQYCNATFPRSREGALAKGRHVNENHKNRVAQERSMGLRPEKKIPPPEGEVFDEEATLLGGMKPREFVAQFGDDGILKLRRARLGKLLSIAPDVSGKVRGWVMENYDSDDASKKDPNSLQSLLERCGVTNKTAQRTTAVIANLDGELRSYIPISQPYYGGPWQPQQPTGGYYPYRSPGDQGPFPRPPMTGYQQPSYGQPYGQPMPMSWAQPPASPGLTKEEIGKTVRDLLNEKTEKEQISRLQGMFQALTEKHNELVGKIESGELLKTKEEPWERPLRDLNEQQKKTLEALENKEKSAIGGKEVSELKELRQELQRTRQELMDSKRKEELTALESRIMGELKGMQAQLAGVQSSSQVVQGYKADEMRLLGQGMEHVAKKEPVRIVIEGAKELLYGVAPPQKRVEEGTGLEALIPQELSVEK